MGEKALRWLGGPDGGVLHIRRADGKVVVVPPFNPGENIVRSCVIRDPVNLVALGEERIKEFIAQKRAEWVTLTDGVWNLFRAEAKPGESQEATDAAQAQEIAQMSFDASKKAKENYGQPVPLPPEPVAGPVKDGTAS